MILVNIKWMIMLFIVGFIISLSTRKYQNKGIISILFTVFNENFIINVLLKLIGLDYINLLIFLSKTITKTKATFHKGIHKIKITPGDNIFINDVD